MKKREPAAGIVRREKVGRSGKSLLGDGQRLPLIAATDMLVLSLQSEGRVGLLQQRELADLLGRIAEQPLDAEKQSCAIALLRGLAIVGTTGGLGIEAANAARAVAELLVAWESSGVDALAELVLRGGDQFAAAVVGALKPAIGRDQVRHRVHEAVRDWLATDAPAWRETAPALGRDLLIGAVAVAMAHAAEHAQAVALASRWPPTRTPLRELANSLVEARDLAAIATIAAPLDPFGMLHREVVAALTAVDTSTWSEAQRQALAQTLWQLSPSPEHVEVFAAQLPAEQWSERSVDLAHDALAVRDDPAVVVAMSASENAVDALFSVIERHPARRKAVRAAVKALDAANPEQGYAARCQWLLRACQAWPSIVAEAGMRRAVTELRDAAKRTGEPALAEHFLDAVRASLTDPALLRTLR